MSEIAIRPATQDDLLAILQIYNKVIEGSAAVLKTKPVDLAERTKWFDALRANGFPLLVAVSVRNEVLGFASFSEWRASDGYVHTVEHTVHVADHARGQGVGTRLMEELFPIARALEKHAMVASIESTNVGSLRFHERLGFEAVAHFRQVGWKFGEWRDVIFAEKLL